MTELILMFIGGFASGFVFWMLIGLFIFKVAKNDPKTNI